MKVSLGEYLRVIRERHGLTQRELARASGVSFATISRIEGGKPAIFWNVVKIASALGISIDDLIRETREK